MSTSDRPGQAKATENTDLSDLTQIPVGGQVLDVAVCGPQDGTPVLLLHGFPAGRATYAPVTARLAEDDLFMIVPDQRGYSPGARPDDVSEYHIDHLVGDVIGLLDALEVDKAHLVGHDWGAMIAWSSAARHPDRFHSLTALSVPHPKAMAWALANDAEQQKASSYIDLLVIPGKAERVLLEDDARRIREMYPKEYDAELVERHVQRLQEPGALTGALGWYRARDEVVDNTPDVAIPTTYIWGEDDPALRGVGALRTEQHVVGDYRYLPVSGAGHWLPELNTDLVADEILRHVSTGSN